MARLTDISASWLGDAGSWVVDLDGVVWLSEDPIQGAGGAVLRLREAGSRVLFVTNNSAPTTGELIERLSRAGIPAELDDLVTSAQAAASLVEPGQTVLAVAEGGVREALLERGVELRPKGPVDVVVVGWTRAFDFDVLADAASAIRAGARLIGTNEDPTHPTPAGLLPGSGALLAAVASASGVDPQVAGKPHEPIIELIRKRADHVAVVVGDRPSTDGLMAEALGAPFALVLSGVTAAFDPDLYPVPAKVAADLGSLVDEVLGS